MCRFALKNNPNVLGITFDSGLTEQRHLLNFKTPPIYAPSVQISRPFFCCKSLAGGFKFTSAQAGGSHLPFSDPQVLLLIELSAGVASSCFALLGHIGKVSCDWGLTSVTLTRFKEKNNLMHVSVDKNATFWEPEIANVKLKQSCEGMKDRGLMKLAGLVGSVTFQKCISKCCGQQVSVQNIEYLFK